MKANRFTTEENLFWSMRGQWWQGRWIINMRAFSKFGEGLNALLSREDMEFEEERRTAMYLLVAGEEKVISLAVFKNMFRRARSGVDVGPT